ncbi:hypothetical protein OG366_20350 [Streptomyces cyaneofuscatus]|nr:hypothetical protein OG366_20350 [Streptomyces cyaneofuscatus]
MPQGIEWFEGLSTEEQSNNLRLLSHFCIQAAPPPRTARKVSDAPGSAPRTHGQF